MMQGRIRANRASRKKSINSILVGILSGALLFGPGCQAPRSPDAAAVRSSQQVNNLDDTVGQSQPNGRIVRQDDFEPLENAELNSADTARATKGDIWLAGQNKWDTAMADLWGLPGVAWEDAQVVVQDPTNLVILGVGGGLSIWGEFDFDYTVDDKLRGWEIITHDWTIAVGTSGNPTTHFVLSVALYTHGLLTENYATYDFGKTLTQALVLTGITTVGLKLVAWNHVPNGEMFGWPSGHTASTITVASVVHEYYGLLPAVPLYALTGLVMYERMITGEHWASDVIFGAALGYVIGHSVAGDRKLQLLGMDVVPYINPQNGAPGIGLVKRW